MPTHPSNLYQGRSQSLRWLGDGYLLNERITLNPTSTAITTQPSHLNSPKATLIAMPIGVTLIGGLIAYGGIKAGVIPARYTLAIAFGVCLLAASMSILAFAFQSARHARRTAEGPILEVAETDPGTLILRARSLEASLAEIQMLLLTGRTLPMKRAHKTWYNYGHALIAQNDSLRHIGSWTQCGRHNLRVFESFAQAHRIPCHTQPIPDSERLEAFEVSQTHVADAFN